MRVQRFFRFVLVSMFLLPLILMGCREKWPERTEIKLISGKIIICEKGMSLDTNRGATRISCYNESGIRTEIPWGQVVGMQKMIPTDTDTAKK